MMDPRQELEELRRLEELEARAKSTAPSKEWMARTAAGMTLANKPWYTRAAIQMGAGVDDVVTGVKQLFTKDTPDKLSDLITEDTPYKRSQREVDQMRLVKRALADQSDTHKLPDFIPTGGSALQIAGNALPFTAIPALGAPTAGGFLPWAAAAFGFGAGQGMLEPVGTGESRTVNAVKGGVANVVLPLGLSGLNSARRMVTRGGAAERAGEEIAQNVTEGASRADRQALLQQTLERLQGRQGGPQGPIPLSTAAQLSDAQLARLEAGSRARNGANWFDFDQTQARAVADELNAATRGADDLAARRALRSTNRETLVNQAMSNINEPAFARDLTAFRASLAAATRSAEASNPAVRNMLTQLADEIDRLGPDFRPEHLATIRANLASKSPMVPTNAYQAAPRESPATMSVLGEVDRILNNATGGRWDPVLKAYKRDSDIVRSSQAAGRVREAFVDPATGRVRGVSADPAGDVPKITEAGLGRALDAARGPRKELVLDPTTNARLEAVLGALRAQNIVQNVKRSATAGGGSNTASDMMAAQTARQVANGLPGARGLVDRAINYSGDIKDEALARALQNPDEMIRLIQQQIQRGQPLTPGMEAFMRLISSAPAAAANN